jgi:aryl-alcohol dehydrogenase-like predicted oxidoreductase
VEHRNFDGTPVSRLGLGCSNFGKRIDAAAVGAVVGTALDCGITFFDVADVYGGGTAEALLGRALGDRRDEAVIATKFGHGTGHGGDPAVRGGHPRNVVRSAEASLRALGTDRIDLFQLHEPDPVVPVGDTLAALHGLVEQGKVRWVGCSNVTLDQLRASERAAAERGVGPFRTVQNEYSLLVRDAEKDLLPHCRDRGLGFLPYFPLASGLLTGKYRIDQRVPAGTRVAAMKPDKLFRFFTPRALDLVEELHRFGASRGRDPLGLALAFLLAEPAVLSVIAGAMTPAQVRANAAAAAGGLSADDLDYLRAVSS